MPRFTNPSATLALSLLAAVLLFASCGAASRPTVETASAAGATAAIPAVPTTAPILLPPEDLNIPAEAPVTVQLAAPSNPENSDTEIDPATNIPAGSVAVAVESAGRWNSCIVSAADAVGASNVLDPIAGATRTDLSSLQLNSLAAASVDCGLVVETLSLTDLADHLGSGTSCMNQWLQSSGGGSVFTGLVSVGFGQATPAWAHDHFTSAIVSCFVGTSFAAEVLTDVSADPSIVAAFDPTCLATSFDASGVMSVYASTLASTPLVADLSIGLDDDWVLTCASVGTIVASAAAAEGIALSASTVACLDAEFRSAGLVSGLINGTADSEAVGLSTIACLSNQEAALILG